MKLKKVCIVGLGLLGSSIGKALKSKGLADCVYGVVRKENYIDKAIDMGIIDAGSLDIKQGVCDADFIILAVPVKTVLKYIDILSELDIGNTIVTDVGSTKLDIVNLAEKKLVNFVGSHPMTGSEKFGMDFADENLYKNKLCILTETYKTNEEYLQKVEEFWEELGSYTKIVTPEKHDKVLAEISHLPHLTAVSLVNSVDEEFIEFAASGFCDITRIASGSAVMWNDICESNTENIIKAIEVLQENLNDIKDKLQNKDCKGILEFLENAKQKRDKLIELKR
jgi:prephenate dehydrogenase